MKMNLMLSKLLVIIPLILLAACNTVSRNELEKKIEGKWQQTGGSGAIADMNLLFEYTFTDKKEFTQEAQSPGDQVVLYKQGFIKKGIFQIKDDSIHLYNESNTEIPFYSAKIQFDSNTKFMLFDGNGELDYERKN